MPVLRNYAANRLTGKSMQLAAVRDVGRPPASRLPNQTWNGNAADHCASASCPGRWTMPWKNRRRPIFEQQWGCSSRCLGDLIHAAIRREAIDCGASELTIPHRHRVPLGLVLLAQGWITQPQLQSALQAQKSSGEGRIGDWLSQRCGLGEERLVRGLGVQWNCPVLSTERFSPSAMALVMPSQLVLEYGLLPLRVAGSSLLYMAFEQQMDAASALGAERMSGLKVESGLLPGSQFQTARSALLAARSVPVQIKSVSDRDALAAALLRAIESHQPLASRLVRVHQYFWLRLWMETGPMQGVQRLPSTHEDMQDYLFCLPAQEH